MTSVIDRLVDVELRPKTVPVLPDMGYQLRLEMYLLLNPEKPAPNPIRSKVRMD